jgi:hypothetical protein
MPRKRMIDPEFWSDEEIGSWSHQARLFYIGLWNFADDSGRFKAHDNLLKSQIFPYDVKISIPDLKKELNHKIQWYEVGGLQYGYIRNFLKYQRIDRPTETKLPNPPKLDENSTNCKRALDPNISKVNIREVKEPKKKFLDSVFLTDKEFKQLCADFGEAGAKERIKNLDFYIGSKGDKYKSHYKTILMWEHKNKKEDKPQGGSACKILN